LGDTEKYYFRLDSTFFASPKLDAALYFEMINQDYRNIISAKLSQYNFVTKKKECEDQLSQNSSMVTIYGINDFDKMFIQQYSPCSYDPALAQPIEFRGFNKIYVQFYRQGFHAKLNPKVDEFMIDFNLKLVQSKHLCTLLK
jgi:hypothetical protein